MRSTVRQFLQRNGLTIALTTRKQLNKKGVCSNYSGKKTINYRSRRRCLRVYEAANSKSTCNYCVDSKRYVRKQAILIKNFNRYNLRIYFKGNKCSNFRICILKPSIYCHWDKKVEKITNSFLRNRHSNRDFCQSL